MVGLVGGGAAARGAGRLGLGAGDPAAVASAGGEADHVRRLHRHAPADHQCSSTLVKHIKAPVHLVSSVPSSSSSLRWLELDREVPRTTWGSLRFTPPPAVPPGSGTSSFDSRCARPRSTSRRPRNCLRRV